MKRLAIWYLHRRGYIVVDKEFRGIVIGNCIAYCRDRDEGAMWEVHTPQPSSVIALNGGRQFNGGTQCP